MNRRRRVAVLTTSRAEYGLLRDLIRGVREDPSLALRLLVSGAHLSAGHGLTVNAIKRDGLPISRRLPNLLAGDTTLDVATSAGLAMIQTAQALADLRPDVLVLLGDRFELLAAAAAAVSLAVPIAHVHGGELTFGAVDDAVRHALTKLSSYHFVATQTSVRRVRQMGEPADRVFRVGALGVDAVRTTPQVGRRELEEHLQLPLSRPVAVVTLHPETLSTLPSRRLARGLVRGLERFDLTVVITHPGPDAGREAIVEELAAYAERRPDRACVVRSLGQSLYYSLLAQADVMVGNSSSGLVEAPSFRLPVVNIGDREGGRERAGNVIDCEPEAYAIEKAIRRALSPKFQEGLRGMRNPFGDGRAVERILRHLRRVPLGSAALSKRFCDLPSTGRGKTRRGTW